MDKHLLLFSGILLVLCVTTSTYGQTFRTDYSKLKEDGWIKFHTIPQKWDEAVLTCLQEGAVLASPLNVEIKEALTFMMLRHRLAKPIFTGIHNKYFDYVYQSMEGVSLSDMPLIWKQSPSGESTDKCIVMYLDGSVAESLCQERGNFACYRSNPVDNVNECGTVDREYFLSNITGSCYKYHNDKQHWPSAYKICAAEGGHLAVINSQKEAEVIRELAIEHSPLYESISIGFRTWLDKKTWLTVQGQSLYAAGYSRWAEKEPNNSTDHVGGEYCGGVIVKSSAPYNILNDVSCHYDYDFICEMKPKSVDKYADLIYKYLN